ncbi:MAG TPA: metallophosphoesterase family protein [Polyangiaceae bacterium]|nr:metallophosphoesterase family protein [Polyangiaceae bacterium]
MRFLCLSDVHGDADALAAVLREGRDRGYDQLVVCGDLLFPGPKPLDTWKLLLDQKALCVQGVSDRALASLDPDELKAETPEQTQRIELLRNVHESLGELIIARLGRLPASARLPLENGQEMLIVHGCPADPMVAMSIDMDDDEINALIGDEAADLIVCGASHVPFERVVADTQIVNVGCVGDRPTPGIAHATLIETLPMGVQITPFVVEL